MPSQINKTWLGRAGRVKVLFYGDGHTTRYYFPFPYKYKKHVIVELFDNNKNKWIKQYEGGSYKFINDNTIEFEIAPKKISDTQPKIRIRRCTLACGTELTNKFTPIADPDTNDGSRGETNGTPGILVDDRDDPLRPFKPGDTITYTSPCIKGANVNWYKTPRTGGSASLVRSTELRGEDRTTSLTIDDTLKDNKLSIRVKCIGCGPPDGLCSEFNGSTPEFEDTSVLESSNCGEKAEIGTTSTAKLHNIGSGHGVISLTATSPPAGQTFVHTFPNGNTATHTVNANTPTAFIINKPTDSAYITIETGSSSSAWQYSLRCTQPVDTTQYEYARWVGSGVINFAEKEHLNAFGNIWHTTAAFDDPKGPWTTAWYKYNDFSANKTDGFLQLNDPQVCKNNGWNIAVHYYGPYFYDLGIGNNHLKEAAPWQSSSTLTGVPNTAQSYGIGPPLPHMGGISVNGLGLCEQPGFTFYSRQEADSASISGTWEFSNSPGEDKTVEASWDGTSKSIDIQS